MSSCSICLEPFFPTSKNASGENSNFTALGAVDPCGHIFHYDCFGSWQSKNLNYCKCPECNQVSKKCIKLFNIAPPESMIGVGQGTDDDLSLSSSSSTEEDGNSDGEADHPDEDDCFDSNKNPVETTDAVDVIDLTSISSNSKFASSCQQVTKEKGSNSADILRYKQAAKRYRGLYKQKNSQCQELDEQRKKLLEIHNATKEDNKALLAARAALEELDQLQNARTDALKLRLVNIEAKLEKSTSLAEKMKLECNQWHQKYSDLEKSFKKEIQRVKSSDMAEVKVMMKERLQLLNDNQKFVRERSTMLQEILELKSSLKRKRQQETSSISSTISDGFPAKKNKASSVAKQLRQMEKARFPNASSSENSRGNLKATFQSLGKAKSSLSVASRENLIERSDRRFSMTESKEGKKRSDFLESLFQSSTNRPGKAPVSRRVSMDSDDVRRPSLSLSKKKNGPQFSRRK